MANVKRGMVLWLFVIMACLMAAIAASVPRAIESLLPMGPHGFGGEVTRFAFPAPAALKLRDDPAIAATLAATDALIAPCAPRLGDLPLVTYENVAEFCSQSKIYCAQATLRLIEGRRDSALAHIVSVCVATQTHIVERPNHGVIHAALAVKGIAVASLELYILNAVETSAECERAAAVLAALAAADLPLAEPVYQPHQTAWHAARDDAPPREHHRLIPYDAARARLQLLRVAVAARQYKLLHGAFPADVSPLAALIPGPAPCDPMNGGPIRARAEHDAFIIWTPGPDGADDNGARPFDPRQGWISGGDIIVRVEAERRYPFPAQPPRASVSAAGDIFRHYPRGLPMDVFSDLQAAPLLCAPALSGDSLIIFSRGPEKIKHCAHDSATPAYPHPSYDPTNGVISGGYLTATIPLPPGAPRDRVLGIIALQ